MAVVECQDAVGVIVEIWSDLLDWDVEPTDDFFDIGGYSLLVVQVIAEARKQGLDVEARDIYLHRTPVAVAAAIADRAAGSAQAGSAQAGGPLSVQPASSELSFDQVWALAQPRDPAGDGTACIRQLCEGDPALAPLFVLHWGTGNVGLFEGLVGTFAGGRRVYGLQAIGFVERRRPDLSIEQVAANHRRAIRAVQPDGELLLIGPCAGGRVAYEIARAEHAEGHRVGLLALINCGTPGDFEFDPGWGLRDLYDFQIGSIRERAGVRQLGDDEQKVLAELLKLGWIDPGVPFSEVCWAQLIWAAGAFAQEHHEPRGYAGEVLTFDPAGDPNENTLSWPQLAPRTVQFTVPGQSTLDVLGSSEFRDEIVRRLASAG